MAFIKCLRTIRRHRRRRCSIRMLPTKPPIRIRSINCFWMVVGIPIEGETGQFLRKVTATSYDVEWQDTALDDLSDVEISTSPAAGEVLTFSGDDVDQRDCLRWRVDRSL